MRIFRKMHLIHTVRQFQALKIQVYTGLHKENMNPNRPSSGRRSLCIRMFFVLTSVKMLSETSSSITGISQIFSTISCSLVTSIFHFCRSTERKYLLILDLLIFFNIFIFRT